MSMLYKSVKRGDIVLATCPIWTGELDIYSDEVKSLDLAISVINKSKRDFKIDRMEIRIRKGSIPFFSYKSKSIEMSGICIEPNSRFDINYNLKPVLDAYGDKAKFRFRIVSGRKSISTKLVSLKTMQESINGVYKRHF